MFFNNLQKNQPAATVNQQSTPESTVCVELSDEELCEVNGGSGHGYWHFDVVLKIWVWIVIGH